MNSDSTDHTSDETPHELDEFTVRRVRSALGDVETADPDIRSRHIAAALAAFDDVLDEALPAATTLEPRNSKRRPWMPAASVAAALILVVGIAFAFSSNTPAGNDSMASDVAEAADADADVWTDIAGTLGEVPESSDAASSFESQAPVGPSVAADMNDDVTDLGTFQSTDDLRVALDAYVAAADGEMAGRNAAPDETAAASPTESSSDAAAPTDSVMNSTPNGGDRCGLDGSLRQFVAQVGGAHYVIGVSILTGEVIARDASSCAEVPL